MYLLSLMSFHHGENFSGKFIKEKGKIARKRGSLPRFERKIGGVEPGVPGS